MPGMLQCKIFRSQIIMHTAVMYVINFYQIIIMFLYLVDKESIDNIIYSSRTVSFFFMIESMPKRILMN